MRGEAARQEQERNRQLQIMQLEAGKNEALTGLRQQRAEAIGDIVGGIGTIGGAAFDAFGAGMFGSNPVTSNTSSFNPQFTSSINSLDRTFIVNPNANRFTVTD